MIFFILYDKIAIIINKFSGRTNIGEERMMLNRVVVTIDGFDYTVVSEDNEEQPSKEEKTEESPVLEEIKEDLEEIKEELEEIKEEDNDNEDSE